MRSCLASSSAFNSRTRSSNLFGSFSSWIRLQSQFIRSRSLGVMLRECMRRRKVRLPDSAHRFAFVGLGCHSLSSAAFFFDRRTGGLPFHNLEPSFLVFDAVSREWRGPTQTYFASASENPTNSSRSSHLRIGGETRSCDQYLPMFWTVVDKSPSHSLPPS